MTGQTTHALDELPERVTEAGFTVEALRTGAMGSLMELDARNPRMTAS
jgi:hypothetical protein